MIQARPSVLDTVPRCRVLQSANLTTIYITFTPRIDKTPMFSFTAVLAMFPQYLKYPSKVPIALVSLLARHRQAILSIYRLVPRPNIVFRADASHTIGLSVLLILLSEDIFDPGSIVATVHKF